MQITDSINHVHGKVIALMNMGYWERKRGNKTKQLELYIQAAQILGQIRASIDLRKVLYQLSDADETKRIIYLAQAVWLCLRVEIPLSDAVDTLEVMYRLVPQRDQMKALDCKIEKLRHQPNTNQRENRHNLLPLIPKLPQHLL